MTTTSAVPAPASVTPEDFADPNALTLGEFSRSGGSEAACRAALRVVEATAAFGVEAVQFYFNGSPAVARVGQDVDEVFRDWNTRRDAYQKAAGIVS